MQLEWNLCLQGISRASPPLSYPSKQTAQCSSSLRLKDSNRGMASIESFDAGKALPPRFSDAELSSFSQVATSNMSRHCIHSRFTTRWVMPSLPRLPTSWTKRLIRWTMRLRLSWAWGSDMFEIHSHDHKNRDKDGVYEIWETIYRGEKPKV